MEARQEPDRAFVDADEAIERLFTARRLRDASAASAEFARVRRLYRDGTDPVRYHLITELVELEYLAALPLLVEALSGDSSALVRHEAAFGIGTMGREAYVDGLSGAMLNGPHEMVRHEAAVALAAIGGPAQLEPLERASQDSSEAVVGSAHYAIQQILLRSSQTSRGHHVEVA